MSDQSAVVEATPTPEVQVMEVERGPLVNLTSDERVEFRRTGNLPKQDPPKNEESAPSDPPKVAEADAGDPPPPITPQERSERDKAKAAKRFTDLLEENKRLKADLEARKPAEPKQEPKPVEPQYTRPKPTADDKDDKGNPKYSTYEDFVEDLADWKGEQRDAKNQREQREQSQANAFNAKVEEARARYENFDEVVGPTATAINTDAKIFPVVKQMMLDSEVLPDLLFTIGSDSAEMEKFVKMAKENPGKALRYIALTESLIADELEGKSTPAVEAPVKPKTQAPKPPSEAGGRAAAPPDALEAAAKANDFRSFKAEATRRQLAKLKT